MNQNTPTITVTTDICPDTKQAIDLYLSAGWGDKSQYEPEIWAKALTGSASVICAFDGPRLVGITRVLSDNAHDSQITDMVVHPHYQKQGIGSRMMTCITEKYGNTSIYLNNVISANNQAFFEKFGFQTRPQMAVISRRAAPKIHTA